MSREEFTGWIVGGPGLFAAIAIWWWLLEACPQVTRAALQVARVTVLYVVARG